MTPSKSVSELSGTISPTTTDIISRHEDEDKGPGSGTVRGNGYAEGFIYNSGDDTFAAHSLAFDGAMSMPRLMWVPILDLTQGLRGSFRPTALMRMT